MEMNLNNLIEKIKKDGIEQAENEALVIQAQARREAEKSIAQAAAQAKDIIAQAKQEAGHFKESSEAALKQAARDALLALRGRATEFFARVVKDKIAEELHTDALKDIILKAVEYSVREGALDIEIVLSQKDKQDLEKILFTELRKQAQARVILQAKKEINKGFRIGETGAGSYLDFTDQAIADSFSRYLNPRLVDALDIDLGLKQEQPNAE
jgi:V/A-type H+/Na+-transporting ATPase subunit E